MSKFAHELVPVVVLVVLGVVLEQVEAVAKPLLVPVLKKPPPGPPKPPPGPPKTSPGPPIVLNMFFDHIFSTFSCFFYLLMGLEGMYGESNKHVHSLLVSL